MKTFGIVCLLVVSLAFFVSAQEIEPTMEPEPESEPTVTEITSEELITPLSDRCLLSRERCLLICDRVRGVMDFDCDDEGGAFSSSCACGSTGGSSIASAVAQGRSG
eukprot:TRINITY_DN1713_c0_g1_i1.p3 TRINITY_DN1713_c0_g1~~TRINITY_DN1713_c0_g1_i1.p3  ORF type:complete len:107 (-),score=14.77 TRINITY_DN1713_c0_g1_i1:270-590(-)